MERSESLRIEAIKALKEAARFQKIGWGQHQLADALMKLAWLLETESDDGK